MELGMAPPHKRRKLSESSSRDGIIFEGETARPAPTLSHGVSHLTHVHAASGSRQVPQRIEEVHLQIHQLAVGAADSNEVLHRRQGTGVSSETASVTSDSSTTAQSTATDSASSTEVTSTTAITDSASTSGSTDASSSASSTDSFTSTSSDSASQSTESPTSSNDSTSASSTSSSRLDSTASGFIDSSPTAGSASSTNSSSSDAATLTGTVTSLSSATLPRNLTTSALIVQDSSTTYTTRTTIELNSSASRSDSRTTDSSSQTLGAAFYLATLANGRVETLSRSGDSYITTFSDGSQATVPAATGSYVTATGTDGVTSVVYETTSAAASGSGGDPSTITSVATIGGAGQQGSATSSSHSSTRTGSGGGGSGSTTTAPPGTIAGGVVGGAAGLAVIVLIAMLFLRWYRRRSQIGHHALPPNAGVSPSPDHAMEVSRGGPGMAERAGLMPAMAAVPAIFRHSNKSREVGPPPSERSFTRVSGRKLPSSFSPGMSTNSPPPNMPLTDADANLSTTSFYRDSTGFYGGGDSSVSPGSGVAALGAGAEQMTLSPGPQRRPTVHTGGPYVLSPPSSSPTSPRIGSDMPSSPPGTAATTATFERSETPSSLDPSRGSRFTEEV
ncbi:hypothetical protein LTS10_003186 [Elasticomyces elasticus]|nr:hypothetical protein LTS10_003186 [Elasticomyces elasticus]